MNESRFKKFNAPSYIINDDTANDYVRVKMKTRYTLETWDVICYAIGMVFRL